MEQILPVLEGQLRCFRRHAGWLAAAHPRLAGQLGPLAAAPDVHVDRLVQGVAMLHARSVLALQRARCRQDEHLLELYFPGQLRPFPACRIGPDGGGAAEFLAARYCGGPQAAIELDLDAVDTRVDVYIDGDAAFCAALRSAMLAGYAGDGGHAAASRPGPGEWRCLPRWPCAPIGLDPAEALLPRPPGAHAGLALLREFFTFPARFNVLRLDLSSLPGLGRWTLRLPVPRIGERQARLLEPLHAGHLRAGWSARAGLWHAAAAPILVNGYRDEFVLSVPSEQEIFSVDRVHLNGAAHPGWVAHRVEGAPPGHEWRIAFATGEAGPPSGIASVDVTVCERGAVLARPARGAAARWQLNSLLALQQLPHSAGSLREVMATQAIGASPASQAMIGAVQGLECRPALLRVGRAAPLQGTTLCLTVDETPFAGCGLLLFAQVMDRFFGECAQLNTFTRLVLVSAATGEELMRCKARNTGIVLE